MGKKKTMLTLGCHFKQRLREQETNILARESRNDAHDRCVCFEGLQVGVFKINLCLLVVVDVRYHALFI